MIEWVNSKKVIGRTVTGNQMYVAEILDDGTYTVKGYGGRLLECSKFLGINELEIRVQDFIDRPRTYKENLAKEARDKVAIENAVQLTTLSNTVPAEVFMKEIEVAHPVDPVVESNIGDRSKFAAIQVTMSDGKVYISDPEADKIKYTLDGKSVTNFAKVYKEPVDYVDGMVIKAKSYKDGKELHSYGV